MTKYTFAIGVSAIAVAAAFSTPALAQVATPDGEVTCTVDPAGNVSCSEGGDEVVTGTVTAGTTLLAQPGFAVDGSVPTFVADLTAIEPLATFQDGAPALSVLAEAGGIDVTFTGDIYTSGTVGAGPTFADAVTLITTSGGDITATFDGQITTIGDTAFGAFLLSDGAIDVTFTGEVYTEGDQSNAIFAQGNGDVAITCADVTTLGAGADAVYGQSNGGTVTIDCGNISTAGEFAIGIASDNTATVNITAGDITTDGTGSEGVSVSGIYDTVDVAVGNISIGTASNGLEVVDTFAADVSLDYNTITVRAGAVGSIGILASAANLSVNGGNITVEDSAAAQAINLESTNLTGQVGDIDYQASGNAVRLVLDGQADFDIGNVDHAGSGVPAVLISSSGADYGAGVRIGDITTAGDLALGLAVRAEDSNVIIETGDVTTTGADADTIDLFNLDGAGSVTWTLTTGVLSATGDSSHALQASGGDSSFVLDIGGASTSGLNMQAIRLESGTGSIDLTTRGAVSADAAPAMLLSVDNGGVTLDAQGDVTGTDGIIINQTGGAQVALGGTVSATAGDALRISGGSADVSVAGSVVGPVQLTASDDTFTVDAGGSVSLTGNSDFGAGTDEVTNSGTFSIADGTVLANLELFNNAAGGTLNLGAGETLGAAALVNAGTLTTVDGTVVNGFDTNDGAIVLGTGLSTFQAVMGFTNNGSVSAAGDSTFAATGTFTNNGMIDLSEGNTLNTLTIAGDYIGTGDAAVRVNYFGDAADQLVIQGNASGVTTIMLDESTPFSFGDQAIVLVDAATADEGAFVLEVTMASPLLQQSLEQNGGVFTLVNAPTLRAFEPAVLPAIFQGMDTASGEQVFNYAAAAAGKRHPTRGSGVGSWGSLYASREEIGDDRTLVLAGMNLDIDEELETERFGIQVGADWLSNGPFLLGVTGGYQTTDSEFEANDTTIDADAFNFGFYGQFGPHDGEGLSATFLVKKDWIDATLSGVAFADQDVDADTTSAEGRVSYRFAAEGSLRVQADAGVAWRDQSIDSFSTGGLDYELAETSALHGSVGVRFTVDKGVQPFIAARWNQEFDSSGDFSISNGGDALTVDTLDRGDFGRIELGIEGGSKKSAPMVTAWVEFGDVEAIGASVGWRF